MDKAAKDSRTVEVPRSVLEDLLKKIEDMESRLESSEKEGTSEHP